MYTYSANFVRCERLAIENTGSMTKTIARKGRLLAAGTRTTPRQRLRVTVYLSPDVAHVLAMAAAASGRERSDIVTDALRVKMGIA